MLKNQTRTALKRLVAKFVWPATASGRLTNAFIDEYEQIRAQEEWPEFRCLYCGYTRKFDELCSGQPDRSLKHLIGVTTNHAVFCDRHPLYKSIARNIELKKENAQLKRALKACHDASDLTIYCPCGRAKCSCNDIPF